jgi:exodeoxyribonuclease X
VKLIRVIDTETTGLDHALHRICEIATVDLHVPEEGDGPNQPTRGRMWGTLVNPERPIPPDASGIHDITDEMVAEAPTMRSLIGDGVIIEVKDKENGRPDYWAAHNSRFDQKFIDPVKGLPWIDTYRVAIVLWPNAPNYKNATLRYYLKLKLAGGADAGARGRSHTALWDAYVTAAILRRAILEGMTVEEMIEISSRPAVLSRLGFGKHFDTPIADVPEGYLRWVLTDVKDNEDALHTANHELTRRRSNG